MIIDSSAIVAIIRREPGHQQLQEQFVAGDPVRVSAATVLETSLVLGRSRSELLDEWMTAAGAEIVPFDVELLAEARAGHIRYGRGSHYPAHLNFGDCFSYALAKVTGEPLLFKGDDFVHTDIEPAIPSVRGLATRRRD